jgi:glycosyltransferase involved in cell wall biosynthesis
MSNHPSETTDVPISLSVIILTYNEELNLPYLLESLTSWVANIYVVDSGSTDKTIEIAESYGAQVVYHPFINQAVQLNWGLGHLDITTDWIMRMDADEVVMPELAQELCQVLPTLPSDVTGLYVKRRVYFMGRWIRHGAYYPTWLLRVFRTGKAFCEQRWMDEHMILTEGRSIQLAHDIIDENHKGLSFWTIKHDHFANREMLNLLDIRSETENNNEAIKSSLIGQQDQRKRWLKGNVYMRAPLFLRAFLYFLYRYCIRLGFLDGREGLIFHTLQAFWYRFYVDAKIWEARKLQNTDE